MKKTRSIFLLLLVAAVKISAQNVRARATLDTSAMWPGDHNSLILSVLAPPETSLDSFDLRPLEAVVGAENVLEKGTWAFAEGRWNLEVKFTAFDSGRFEIRPVEIFYTQKSTGEVGSAATNATVFEVIFLSISDTSQLAPIKPILREPTSIWDHLPMFLAFLAVIAVAVGLYFLIEKPLKNRRSGGSKTPEITPWERALRQMDELERRDLWQKGEPKKFHELLNATLREYFGARFGLRATKMTSAELLAALPKNGLAEAATDSLAEMLETVDLVKFAEARPPEIFHPEALEKARSLVAQTMPEGAGFAMQLAQNQSVMSDSGDEILKPKTAFTRRTRGQNAADFAQKMGPEFAAPSRRLAAGAVDLAVWLGGLVFVLRLVWPMVSLLGFSDEGGRGTAGIALVTSLALVAFSWFFHVFLEQKGFTPGKMAFGIRAIDAATGLEMTPRQALIRASLKLSPTHWGLRGAENDLENRASHDLEAGTAVVVR